MSRPKGAPSPVSLAESRARLELYRMAQEQPRELARAMFEVWRACQEMDERGLESTVSGPEFEQEIRRALGSLGVEP